MSKLLPVEEFDSLALLEADESPLDTNKQVGNGQSDKIRIVLNEADVTNSILPFQVERYQKLGNYLFL